MRLNKEHPELLIVKTSRTTRGDFCAPLMLSSKTVDQLKSKEKHTITAYEMTTSIKKVFHLCVKIQRFKSQNEF